ncbi:arsenate reductase/protein-tyrosine-phosphatase family protein [Gordonia rhizosphera]|uniref:Phosphotyrosine protein phosphatase I domain-containing protein n=1 Tax=Gordonia rhizosphera NBRC 16068 TaxID=1108045 RepID=K6WGS0_9ACTN|nr:protein-tyrosine-phosphatase [Gordonia rhizosphera]GAB91337.1 putative protein-tyrosine phosphatase [Gordonia rhizosphera NBRC 16068]
MSEPLRILFVCTGNICRSPMAERICAGIAAATGVSVEVASAGVGALNGQQMHPYAVDVLREHRYDPDGFESRYLRPSMVSDADLVLCLAREHRAKVQQAVPVRWKRAFTLVEFAELSSVGSLDDILGARGRVDTNAEWLDIADPIGHPREDFERVYAEVEPQVQRLVEWVAVATTD